MSPEAYRAALEYARANGDWAFAERVTRARAGQHMFAAIMAFARSTWRALRAGRGPRRI